MGRTLAEFVIRTTLIAMATGASLWALRIRSASAKHAAWTGVMLAMLLLPAWIEWGPKASLPVLPAHPVVVTDVTPVAVTEAPDAAPIEPASVPRLG